MTKTALLKQMEELIEEPGLTCCICREGYKFQVKCNTFAKHSHHLRGLSIQLHRVGCIGGQEVPGLVLGVQRWLGCGSMFPVKAGKKCTQCVWDR